MPDSQIPSVPPAAQADRLPLPVGTVVAVENAADLSSDKLLTDLEREALTAAGANPGERPDLTTTKFGKDLTDQIDAIRKGATSPEALQGLTPVAPDTPPIEIPEPVDIGTLPPEQQAELRKTMEQYRANESRTAEQTAPGGISNVPGMEEAWSVSQPTVQVINDLADPIPSSDPQPFSPLEAEEETAQPKQPEPDFDPLDPGDKATPTEDGAMAGASAQAVSCPQCGFNVHAAVNEPSEQDIQDFVATTLGAKRFRKQYEILGGNIIFVLRTLTPGETDTILNQINHDLDKGRIAGRAGYLQRMEDYRLCAAIEKFERIGSNAMGFIPLCEFRATGDEPTVLPQLFAYIHDNVFVQDHVRRVVGQHWARFGRLIETLEARSENPDFWKTIENVS